MGGKHDIVLPTFSWSFMGINLGELLIFESGITNMLPWNMAGKSPLIIVDDVDVPSYKP